MHPAPCVALRHDAQTGGGGLFSAKHHYDDYEETFIKAFWGHRGTSLSAHYLYLVGLGTGCPLTELFPGQLCF